jgi:sodium/bile acid cotransporter 7
MTTRLALLVVTPTVLAQLIRLHRPAGAWATRHKVPLAVAAQCGILTMVFVGATGAGLKLASREIVVGWLDWVTMPAATLGVHLAILFTGHGLGRMLGVGREDRIAVGFAGSQKTLMVGLDVSLKYFAHQPLAVLPMIVYHVGQLVADTVVADRLHRRHPVA